MILSYVRTIILYLVLIAVIRMMGKRQVGQMEPSEFVVTMLVANLASIPMQDSGIPLYSGLVPILTVLGVELVLTGLNMRCVRLRRLLCGKPVILIENGKIIQENLQSTRVTLDELTELLRTKDMLTAENVQYAILETNGELSVFPYPQFAPANAADAGIRVPGQSMPYTVIADGRLYEANLRLCGREMGWLNKELKARNAKIKSTFLMTVDGTGHIYWVPKEAKK